MEVLDRKDVEIVVELLNDSRASLRAISREVDLGVNAVKARIGKLMARGGIEKFLLLVNPAVLGYSKVCVFSYRDNEVDEETLARLRLLGKPVAQSEIIGGVSWLAIVVNKKNEGKITEFKGSPKLIWIDDILLPRHFSYSRLSTTDLLIIKYLLYNPRAGVGEVARQARVSPKTVSHRLEFLKNEKVLGFGLQINPSRLGVVDGKILVKIKTGAPKDTFERLDQELKTRLLFVRYRHIDSTLVRAHFAARDVFEIDSIMKAINSLEGIESAEAYPRSRLRVLEKWVLEEIEERLERERPKGWKESVKAISPPQAAA